MPSKRKVNFSDTLRDLQKLRRNFPEAAKNITKEIAGEAVKRGQEGIVPRRSSNLASTLRVVEESGIVLFVAGGIDGQGNPSKYVDYAYWVNNGSSKQPAQFFMERSARAALQNFNSIALTSLRSWMSFLNGEQ